MAVIAVRSRLTPVVIEVAANLCRLLLTLGEELATTATPPSERRDSNGIEELLGFGVPRKLGECHANLEGSSARPVVDFIIAGWITAPARAPKRICGVVGIKLIKVRDDELRLVRDAEFSAGRDEMGRKRRNSEGAGDGAVNILFNHFLERRDVFRSEFGGRVLERIYDANNTKRGVRGIE
ncbi:hypothetical protein R3P38DRAFT_2791067 [Favolaschia claudopus]|uniref:Uncharacterized protein n=1 Tax=Favolaschia claudopus TaxID=2862362 RepID=A0AAW0AHU3_9AGAR